MDILQYLIYFGIFMMGIFSHEGAHAMFAHFYKLNPEVDLWHLKVLYDQTDNNRAIRLIGLAPLLLGGFVALTEAVYIVATNSRIRMSTILFLTGLLIGTSASDLSVQITKQGEWKAWKKIPGYFRVMAGGVILWLVAGGLPMIFYNNNALFVVTSSLDPAAIGVVIIGFGMWVLKDVNLDRLKF